MSRYGIIVNVDRCAGCFACAVACKEENQVAPGIFWEKIKRDENVRDNVINWFRMSCMHCDDPACMKVCPMKAIHKGPHGEVLVDQQKCIGCKMCANACPYDVPVFNTEGRTSYFGDKQPLVVRPAKPHTERTPGKAEHCTLCVHRTERGLRRGLRHPRHDARRLRQPDARNRKTHRGRPPDERSCGHASEDPLHRKAHGCREDGGEARLAAG